MIDGYGTVRESRTQGVSLRGTINIGNYATTSTFDEAGGQVSAMTLGTSRTVRGYTTGSYTTLSAYGVDYNNLESQTTEGISFSYRADGTPFTSGVYTTTATVIDGYGTVRESVTKGDSLRGPVNIGSYATTSTFDEAGGQVSAMTLGTSKNIRGYATGSYTTLSAYGLDYNNLESQTTEGVSFSYMADGTQFTSGVYTTTATVIDGYGTVRESVTKGDSLRGLINIGSYATTSTFDEAGGQVSAMTLGTSKNVRGYATGSYTTLSAYGVDYNNLESQITEGVSFSYTATAPSSPQGPTPPPRP